MIPYKFLAVPALLMVGAATLSADTLVLQDGRRLRGELISLNRTSGTVVFDEGQGVNGRARRTRLNLRDVSSIDFLDDQYDDDGPYTDSTNGNGSDPFGRDTRRAPVYGNDRYGRGNRAVHVSATEPWTDTGIDVRAGDTIHFTPEGTVVWGAGRQDTAEGEMNSPVNNRRPIPGRPAAGLIGRIGGSPRDVFFIGGERGPFRIHTTGRLFLGVNDDYLQDNSGSFRVTIQQQ